MNILNIAAYRFVTLNELPVLRQWLLELCGGENLRGTILLAPTYFSSRAGFCGTSSAWDQPITAVPALSSTSGSPWTRIWCLKKRSSCKSPDVPSKLTFAEPTGSVRASFAR